MKASFKFILAALAATAALAACTKETTPPDFENDKVNPAAEGSRVIAVSFAPQTKTTLEGFQPKFVDGKDTVLISNTKALDTCVVSVDNKTNVATITTKLPGPLTAVYPYTAAKLNGNVIEGVIVPAVQDGEFASANIAMAEDIAASATFVNKTALFAIAPPDGATSVTIKSLNKIDNTTGQRSAIANAAFINNGGTSDADKCVITVANTSLDTFYVSLDPGVKLSDLSFDAGATRGMKGIATKSITDAGITDTTVANTKYTITDSNWHPYVEIKMTVNSVEKTYKWATMNVGATEETGANSYGKYFMWGETTGITPSGGSFTFPDNKYYTADNTSWAKGSGFASTNCPWTDGVYDICNINVFTKYTSNDDYAKSGSADNKIVLELADDAANANWGGSWRMPTKDEYDALVSLNRGDFSSGYWFGTSDEAKIFLPAADGGIFGTDFVSIGCGYYLSSTLDTNGSDSAFSLSFIIDIVDYTITEPRTSVGYRYYGFCVRALSE